MPHRKQHLFYCFVCARCRGSAFTEPLPSIDKGDKHTDTYIHRLSFNTTQTALEASHPKILLLLRVYTIRCRRHGFTKPLPSSDRGEVDIPTVSKVIPYAYSKYLKWLKVWAHRRIKLLYTLLTPFRTPSISAWVIFSYGTEVSIQSCALHQMGRNNIPTHSTPQKKKESNQPWTHKHTSEAEDNACTI
jgi:hypothetical protein